MYFQSGLTSYQTLEALVSLAQDEIQQGNILADALLRDIKSRREHAVDMAIRSYEACEMSADEALRCIVDCDALSVTIY